MSASAAVGRWIGYYEAQLDAGWGQVQGWTKGQAEGLVRAFVELVKRIGQALGRIQAHLAVITPHMPPNQAQALWDDWAAASAWYTAVLQGWRELTEPPRNPEAGFPPAAIVAVVVVAGVTLTVTAAALAWAFVTYQEGTTREEELGTFEKELALRREVFEKTGKLPPSEVPPGDKNKGDGTGWILGGLAAAAALAGGAWLWSRKAA